MKTVQILQLSTDRVESSGLRISAVVNARSAGHVFVYILKNDLHSKPFALIEDLFVEPWVRGHGVAQALMQSAIVEARSRAVYKIIGTIKYDQRAGTRRWYQRFGFIESGTEMRINIVGE
jgi:L-amino acid N-acyltransferase YncA